jgi:hypothetical protein
MNLSEEKIIEIIKTYYSDNNSQYAILLNGEWGCGKTYFVKNNILSGIKDSVYVSLYGVINTSDINKKILYSIMNKKMKMNKKIKKGGRIICSGYRSFSSAISNIFKIPLPDAKSLGVTELMSNFIDVSKSLIIFDDLERVNISINEVLGFINDYVEHKNVKCIIVANEKEIEKLNIDNNYELKIISCLDNNIEYGEKKKVDSWQNDDTNNKTKIEDIKNRVNKTYNTENKYKLIKEKLIGKTIDYVPNMEKIIDNLLEKHVENKKYYEYLKSQKNLLVETLKKDNCHNIRTVIFLLNEYESIFNQIKKQKYAEKEIRILELTFINAINMSVLLKNGVEIKQKLNGAKYSGVTPFTGNGLQKMTDYFTAFDFISDYLSSSSLNLNQMENTLKQYITVEIENALPNDDPYFNLEAYWELEDGEIKEYLEKMIQNFHYGYQVFPKLLRIVSGLEVIGLFPGDIKQLVNLMKNSLIDNKVDYIDFHMMLNDQKTIDVYNKYSKEFNDIINQNRNKKSTDTIITILLSENWGEKLYNLYINNNVIYSEGFLNKIDINLITENIKICTTKDIFYFKYTIDKVYYFGNIKDFYMMDRENLELLIEIINKMNKTKFGKTKIYALNLLVDTLNEKLKLLKNSD